MAEDDPFAPVYCFDCKKQVFPKDRLNILKKVFHKTCLKCATCRVTLRVASVESYQGIPYCKAHVLQAKMGGGVSNMRTAFGDVVSAQTSVQGTNQSTENNPQKSTITYDKRNENQSTENNPAERTEVVPPPKVFKPPTPVIKSTPAPAPAPKVTPALPSVKATPPKPAPPPVEPEPEPEPEPVETYEETYVEETYVEETTVPEVAEGTTETYEQGAYDDTYAEPATYEEGYEEGYEETYEEGYEEEWTEQQQ